MDRKEVKIFPPSSFFPVAIFAGKVIVFAVMHRSWPQIDRNTRVSRSMSKRAISPTDRDRDGPPSPSRSVNDFSGAARRAGGGESSLPPPAAVVTPFRERGSSSLACGSGSEKKFRKVKKEGEEDEEEVEEESAH